MHWQEQAGALTVELNYTENVMMWLGFALPATQGLQPLPAWWFGVGAVSRALVWFKVWFWIQTLWGSGLLKRLSKASKQTRVPTVSLKIQSHNLGWEFPSYFLGKKTWEHSELSSNNSAQNRLRWPVSGHLKLGLAFWGEYPLYVLSPLSFHWLSRAKTKIQVFFHHSLVL